MEGRTEALTMLLLSPSTAAGRLGVQGEVARLYGGVCATHLVLAVLVECLIKAVGCQDVPCVHARWTQPLVIICNRITASLLLSSALPAWSRRGHTGNRRNFQLPRVFSTSARERSDAVSTSVP